MSYLLSLALAAVLGLLIGAGFMLWEVWLSEYFCQKDRKSREEDENKRKEQIANLHKQKEEYDQKLRRAEEIKQYGKPLS